MTASRLASAATLVAVAAVYFLAGKFGLALAFVHPSASGVWPPTGIALAAVLVLGYRVWPAILIGAFLVNVSTAGSLATSAGIAVGNMSEGLLGAYLVNRFAQGRSCFSRPQDVVKFALLAAIIAPTVSATTGVASLSLGGYASWAQFGSIWLMWWLGDAAGALVVAPPLILWSVFPPALTLRRALEGSILLAALALVGLVVFAGFHPLTEKSYPVQFFTIPVLVWAALRFGPQGTATATLVLSAIAIGGTLQGTGPFARQAANESLPLLQGFMGVVGLTSMVLAAAVVERREAQETLRAAEERLRLIEQRRSAEEALATAQAIAHLGSWEWNVEADEITWSDELYRIYGLEAQEFTATYEGFLRQVHPDDRDRVDSIVRAAFVDKRPFAFFERIVRPDGITRILQSRGEVVVDESGRVVRMVGTCHDVTELKQAEEEHAQLIREQEAHAHAEAALRQRDEFLSVAAHELRTPVTSLRLFAQLLSGQLEALVLPDQRILRSAQVIDRQSEKLATLISRLLDVSRVEAGKLRLSRQPTDVDDLVAQAVEAARVRSDGRVITLRASPHAEADIDALRMEQVVTNLLDNALKYSPDAAPIEVEVQAPTDGVLAIVVRDHGIGIPPEHRAHIFERFYQGHPGQLHPHDPDLGLGLYISREIVELHGGQLTAEFPPDGGTRLVVRFPTASTEPGDGEQRPP